MSPKFEWSSVGQEVRIQHLQKEGHKRMVLFVMKREGKIMAVAKENVRKIRA